METHTVHGDWIRWLYFARKMRNAHVAKAVGVTSGCIRQWMTGRKSPTDEHQHALAKLCGVSLAAYFAGPRMDSKAVVRVA
jgi:transcriptional regulator with XRE-family HTH domain